MSTFDEFYPRDEKIARLDPGNKDQPGIGIMTSIISKLEGYRSIIKGSHTKTSAESKLCNWLGIIRRNCPNLWDQYSTDDGSLGTAIQRSVNALKEVGREVNFGEQDPRQWITQRGGYPRW